MSASGFLALLLVLLSSGRLLASGTGNFSTQPGVGLAGPTSLAMMSESSDEVGEI